MAISINTGFSLGAAVPIDTRAYLTKAEMLTVDENIYTNYFLAVCADDGFLYMFDKNAEELDPETGKFKLFAGSVEEAIEILNADENTENSVRYWIKNLAADAAYDSEEKTVWTIEGYDTQYSQADIADVMAGNPLALDDDHQLIYNDEDPDAPKFEIETISTGDKATTVPQSQTVTSDLTIKEKIEDLEEASKVEVTESAETTEGYLKTYVVTQGDEEVGKIDIPKDLVVESGEIIKVTPVIEEDVVIGYRLNDDTEVTYTAEDVADEESDYYGYPMGDGKFIKLVIANQKAPICINIKEIMPEGAGETTEDITANIEVGGIAVGDIIPAGTDLQEFITQLVVKYFPPTISLKSSVTNLVQRVGTVLNDVVLTATVGKKSLDVTGVTIDGTEQTDVAAEGGEYTKTIATVDDSIIFNASATDGKETSTAKVEFKFVYPYMYGTATTIEDIDLDDLTEVVEVKGTKSFTYSANNLYLVFAMPSSYADLTSILDPNGFENIDSWTKTTMTNAAGESYKVYYSNTKIVCDKFKYNFK